MSIQYTGTAPIFDNAWAQSAGTKTELCSRIYENFISAGWSSISVTGGSGARTAFIVRSAATPTVGNQCEVKCDIASTNCVRLYMQQINGGQAQTGGFYLLPSATRVWNMLINKFQFAIWVVGPELAASHALGGVLYIPTHLQSYEKLAIWGTGNGRTDTEAATNLGSFRKMLNSYYSNVTFFSNEYFNINGLKWEAINELIDAGAGLSFFITASAAAAFTSGSATNNMPSMHWYNNSPIISDSLLGWMTKNAYGTRYATIKGQLWDSFISSEPIAGDSQTTFDGHNYIAFTDSNYGSTSVYLPGTLWLATN